MEVPEGKRRAFKATIVATERTELNNKCLVLTSQRKIYMPVAKVANCAIKGNLAQRFLEETRWMTKDEIARSVPSYQRVTVVRNPFDRLVSCFAYFTQTVKHYTQRWQLADLSSFEAFIRDVHETPDEASNKHFRSQFGTLSHDGEYLPHVTVRFERMSELKEHLPVKDIPVIHKSQRGDYRSYFKSAELRALVEARFRKDLEFFSYEF